MVLVQLECGSTRALGYTYADAGTAAAAKKLLEEIVLGSDPFCHAATSAEDAAKHSQSR